VNATTVSAADRRWKAHARVTVEEFRVRLMLIAYTLRNERNIEAMVDGDETAIAKVTGQIEQLGDRQAPFERKSAPPSLMPLARKVDRAFRHVKAAQAAFGEATAGSFDFDQATEFIGHLEAAQKLVDQTAVSLKPTRRRLAARVTAVRR